MNPRRAPSDSSRPTREAIVAAARRLRGHLVAAPVIGDLLLPGVPWPGDLRLKAELLQPGGTLYFRGALHWLLAQLGCHKALRHEGGGSLARAWAAAARSTRAPLAVRLPDEACADDQAFVMACGATLSRGAGDAGATTTPRVDDPVFAAGIGTVLLELGDELPAETRRLVVAPGALAPVLQAAAVALGIAWQVLPAPAAVAPADLEQQFLAHARLRSAGLAALAHAIALPEDGTCVLLGE